MPLLFFFLFRSDSIDTPLTKVCIWFRHVLGWGIKNRTNCTICIETVKVSLCLCNILSMCNIFFLLCPAAKFPLPYTKSVQRGHSLAWNEQWHFYFTIFIPSLLVLLLLLLLTFHVWSNLAPTLPVSFCCKFHKCKHARAKDLTWNPCFSLGCHLHYEMVAPLCLVFFFRPFQFEAWGLSVQNL